MRHEDDKKYFSPSIQSLFIEVIYYKHTNHNDNFVHESIIAESN